ncbi:hypothetical protein K438DRAFT_2016079, partial [Mycena galopus ATCC 62051]
MVPRRTSLLPPPSLCAPLCPSAAQRLRSYLGWIYVIATALLCPPPCSPSAPLRKGFHDVSSSSCDSCQYVLPRFPRL